MAPIIAPLTTVLSRAGIDLAAVPAALRARPDRLFAVVQAGDFGGRGYTVGEVLVCGEPAAARDPVVLVPQGPGRPMLGRLDRGTITGDAGEPCAPARWAVAGGVERAVFAGRSVVEACARFVRSARIVSMAAARSERAGNDGGGAVSNRALGVAVAGWGTRRPSPQPAGQLALFGARAA